MLRSLRRTAGPIVLTTMLAAPAVASDADASAVDAALDRANAAVQAIIDVPDSNRTFDNTIGALDDMGANLELDTNMIMFLAYVSTDAREREIGQAAEQTVGEWAIDLQKREDLYGAVRAYADTNPRLSGEQARLLERTLRSYKRAGMALTAEKRDELAAIQKEITRLGIEFERNIREDETTVPLTRDELGGMSDDYIDSLDRSGDVYLVGMSYPEFLPIQDLCTNETTREKVWIAYKRRGGLKNVAVLEQILALRAEAASILGYQHAADYEIEVRMAKDAATVKAFYDELRPLVRRKAELDLVEFTEAKRADTGDDDATLYPWDQSYYKNKLMRDKYAVDGEKVREYFPMSSVMDGLFSITQSLYGLEYRDITASAESQGYPLWHEDCKLYEVWDKAQGELLGRFYIDLHPRDDKYGHAAQWGLAQHKVWSNGTVQKPLAALVCNFTKPTDTKPSLMSHDEVETFFHEFGHCLHTILSEATYWEFAGTGVERDFVEAPSQMFENWVWDADVLKTFAKHYKTGETLPDELLEGMIAARNLGSGMLAEHQFYYGLTDMAYHTDAEGDVDTTEISQKLFPEVELYPEIPGVYYQASFGHLVGYQAGYYGYQWSLVYASDMFQRFKELGMLDSDAGMYYRKKILAMGGTKDGLDLVRDYLGREPDMKAYLKHLGLE